MLKRFIEKIKFKREFGGDPTVEQFIHKWSMSPESHFSGYFDEDLEWSTCYGVAPLFGIPDSHGLCSLPNIVCQYSVYKYSLQIGWVTGIEMHSGGIVRINHFALNTELTRKGIGEIFFNSIIRFLKSKNAVVIEFHENHSSKMQHYRRFFEKMGVTEVNEGVWQVDLYENTSIPSAVLLFHNALNRGDV